VAQQERCRSVLLLKWVLTGGNGGTMRHKRWIRRDDRATVLGTPAAMGQRAA